MYRFGMRSPVLRLALILLTVAGAGIALSVMAFGANMYVVGTGMAAALLAAIGLVSAGWLAPRSGRGAVVCSAVALGGEVVAALVLLTSPPSNSHLWVPINLGRFGGFIVAGLGLALTLHAAELRRLGPRQVALVSVNILAIAIGIAFAGWENRG